MAKLPRIFAKLFGSGAGVDQISVFGSKFAGSPAFTTDPDTAQSLSNFLTGWAGAAIGGNAPAIEDVNAVFFVLSYLLCYLQQAGVPEWDASTIYYTGSLANSGGVLYISLTDNNSGHAVTDAANWAVYGGNRVRTVTTTDAFGALDGTIRANGTAGAYSVSLPALSAVPVGTRFTLKRADVTVNVVTLAANGAELIDGVNTFLLQGGPNQPSVTVLKNDVGSWDII